MNVIVPMAGAGTISDRGGRIPRFMIDVLGQPLFTWAIQGVARTDRVYFVVKRCDYDQYDVGEIVERYSPGQPKILLLDEPTRGQAESALAAHSYINNDDPVAIVSPDHIASCDLHEVQDISEVEGCSGAIVVAEEIVCGDPMFYVSLRSENETEDYEVNYVTPDCGQDCFAVAGIYYWHFGFEFIRYARRMINKEHHHRSRYYVAPVFNEAVMDNKHLRVYGVQSSAFIQRKNHIKQFAKYRKG